MDAMDFLEEEAGFERSVTPDCLESKKHSTLNIQHSTLK